MPPTEPRRSRRRRAGHRDETAAAPSGGPTLAILGLAAGEAVRWQNAPRGRWHHGTITRRERDGSVGVRGEGGDARSLPVERLEVRRAGARNAWEPLAVRAARAEQLRLEL